jgi:hypothetical protein
MRHTRGHSRVSGLTLAILQEFGMNTTRPLVVALSLLFCGQTVFAQDMSRYRVYALETSVDAVIAAGGARASEAKTLHERPATIKELHWRAPFVSSTDKLADPVREIAFTFYNDALYQIVVNYRRDRMEGLTTTDILDALSATYGAPVPASARSRSSQLTDGSLDNIVIARWESAESLVTLVRGSLVPEFQLILISKPLSALARTAIRESVRLDALEAPRRESEQRKKDAAEATAALDKTRVANRDGFRP